MSHTLTEYIKSPLTVHILTQYTLFFSLMCLRLGGGFPILYIFSSTCSIRGVLSCVSPSPHASYSIRIHGDYLSVDLLPVLFSLPIGGDSLPALTSRSGCDKKWQKKIHAFIDVVSCLWLCGDLNGRGSRRNSSCAH